MLTLLQAGTPSMALPIVHGTIGTVGTPGTGIPQHSIIPRSHGVGVGAITPGGGHLTITLGLLLHGVGRGAVGIPVGAPLGIPDPVLLTDPPTLLRARSALTVRQ